MEDALTVYRGDRALDEEWPRALWRRTTRIGWPPKKSVPFVARLIARRDRRSRRSHRPGLRVHRPTRRRSWTARQPLARGALHDVDD
jgi:hypothetical protein